MLLKNLTCKSINHIGANENVIICISEPILNGVHIAWIIIGVVGLVVLGLFGQDFLRYRSRKSTSRKNRTSVPRDHPRPLPFYKRKFDNPLAMIYAPNDQQSKSVSKRHQAYLAGTTDAQNGNVLNMGGDHFKKRKGTKKKKVRAQQVGPSDNEADSPVKVSAHKKMREIAENYSQGNVMNENATKHVGFLDSRKMATELSPMNSAVNSYENGEVLKEMPVKKYQRPEFVFPPPTEDIVYTIPVATYPGGPSPRNLPPLSNVRRLPMDGTKYANIDSTYTSSELV